MREAEQKMRSLPNPLTVVSQQGLDVMSGLTPPTNDHVDPTIGAKPTVTDAPRFVAGVEQ